MDFSWRPEQEKLYESAYEYTKEHLQRKSKETYSLQEDFSEEQWNLCAKFGLTGGCIPVEYGGQGWDALTMAYVLEAFAYGGADIGLLFAVSAHLFACVVPLAKYGSAKIKHSILPHLCEGHYIGANAITEREAGSDIFSLSTIAQLKDKTYIITGEKSYVTNGPVADYILLYAKTQPEKNQWGVSAFLIDTSTAGIISHDPFHKIGLNSVYANEISFNSCEIDSIYRLGEEGDGLAIFKYSMQWERACLYAIYLGMMSLQLDLTIVYVKKRRQFGKPLSDQPLVMDQIVKMKSRLECSKLLLYRACWKLSNNQDANLDICLSKLVTSKAAIQSSLDAIHLHGAYGIKPENNIERMLRDAVPSTLFSGTSELMNYLIAMEMGI